MVLPQANTLDLLVPHVKFQIISLILFLGGIVSSQHSAAVNRTYNNSGTMSREASYSKYPSAPSHYPQQTSYKNQNWTGYNYQPQKSFDKALLDRYALALFKKYDTDGSGELDMDEFPKLIADFCQSAGKPCPNFTDLQVIQIS
jgi:hypothetical protein